MTRDIKATVAQMKLELALSAPRIPALSTFTPVAFWESIFPELERLWAIEEAAVSLREASEAYQEIKMSADMAAVNYAHRRNAEAREDLFAALPPRKHFGGEESKQ